MKIAFLGDSITLGYALADPSDRFATLVSKRLGAEEVNLGITGTLMAKAGMNRTGELSFVDRVPQAQGADMIVIFGGTNDYFWTDAPIDPPAGKQDGDDYFRHAVRTICAWCTAHFPLDRILLVTPYPHHGIGNILGCEYWHTANEHDTTEQNFAGQTLREYSDCLAQVGAEYGIPVLNLHEVPGFDWKAHTSDGCHPNPVGHAWLADRVGEKIRELIKG